MKLESNSDVIFFSRILNSSNQFSGTLTNISSNDFVGSVSDVEIGKDENHLFVTFYN